MPRYFLHLFDAGRSVFDHVGIELSDDDAAREHALWCVRDVIAHDILARVPVNLAAYMSVQDQDGREKLRVHFREISGLEPE